MSNENNTKQPKTAIGIFKKAFLEELKKKVKENPEGFIRLKKAFIKLKDNTQSVIQNLIKLQKIIEELKKKEAERQTYFI